MGSVFEHGQLRLYLLSVLGNGPCSGYDIIRGLENRFGGLYSPSAGTVYPRLAKLADEGLVERTEVGRRTMFSLSDEGRASLRQRADDVDELERDLDERHRELAEEMRSRVNSGAAQLRRQLEDAARLARTAAQEDDARRNAPDPETGTGTARPDGRTRPGAGRSPRAGGADDTTSARSGAAGDRGIRGRPPAGADWGELARWFAFAASRGLGDGADLAFGRGTESAAPGRARGDDPWAQVSDPVSDPADPADPAEPADPADAGAADPTGPGADAAGDGTGHAEEAPGPGSRTSARPDDGGAHDRQGAWVPFGSRQIPDPDEWGEILGILRDAAGRIQEVLRRDPPPGTTR